ncbi:Nif11-like leader peptide family natural product precursor [Synechococcus sp. UW179A]|uniref:Nif11-like leader peptide family natural product precursor n=1 Tax=Synechococcus sp. UW179A TaxID=2575510 RepID=UPI000E0F9F3F|nr:Nif11-like leader peptide family natural product precursor [Synechococcus sp. UW179A]
MPEEQLKAFLEKVKASIELQEKLKAAKSPEDVVGIAKEHGYELTADKVDQLSDWELEGFSGGGWHHGIGPGGYPGAYASHGGEFAVCATPLTVVN